MDIGQFRQLMDKLDEISNKLTKIIDSTEQTSSNVIDVETEINHMRKFGGL